MLTIRKSDERGHANHGWLDTRHSFSFANYYDPRHMGYRALRVINEDVIAGGGGFPTHPHRDMEILTFVIEGELAHRDSMGHERVIRPGDVQHMSAGKGLTHSEYNASPDVPVHLMQIWIQPRETGIEPVYGQQPFPAEPRTNTLFEIAADNPADGAVRIHADARVYTSLLDAGRTVEHPLQTGRGAWLQVLRGAVELNGQPLQTGDGASVEDEPKLTITAREDAELLLFDLT